ncbi:DUF5977 domain-containing protein [Rubrolithibacter danxiaensis]|uniref:DUF5977 domain-containing protein n=1 Tax=Rubrolithibacter danxiaensis TaxID=3390805 RepID=UPI003BF7D88C
MKRSSIFFKICITLILFSLNSYSQSTGSYTELNKKIIPQPPNVASLLKFNEVPVNSFNGTADISIPLFDIKENSISLPINLSYHTGGIRVNEEASWVGLGWNLGIGGVIQEIIVGEPDNETNGFYMDDYDSAPKPYSSYHYNFGSSTNIVEAGLCYNNSNGQVTSYPYEKVNKSNFEYDLFSFNFGHYSGKCIFPDLKNGVCLDKQNIILRKNNSTTTSIEAIAPDGTQFIFDIIGYTSTPRTCEEPTKQPVISRTWYLSKIIYPDKKEVSFSYTKTTSRTLPTLNESWSKIDFGESYKGLNISTINRSQNFSTVENYWLDEVKFPTGSLKFLVSGRLDMENTKKLDAIKLYNNIDPNVPVKQINFQYDYFNSAPVSQENDWTTSSSIFTSSLCAGQTPYNPSDDNKKKRLKLLKVETSDGFQITNLPAYKFVYNSTLLPPKTSLSQDLWGFYNGANANTNSLPDYNKLGYWDSNIPYSALNAGTPSGLARRSSNKVYMEASSLKGILYPTGAYTAFRYESNQIKSSNLSFTNVTDKTVRVIDYGVGVDQKIFDIPDINYQVAGNPSKIHITLFCCGYRVANCANSTCTTYNINAPNKGLYATLEYFDTTLNQWTLTPDHTYDLSKAIVQEGYGDLDIQEILKPGKYRLTANYPDDSPLTTDYSKTIASIAVTYKDFQLTDTEPITDVGGLRIKSIVTYNTDGNISSNRKYEYKGGKLMVNPLFYRVYTPTNASTFVSADCPANHQYENIFNDIIACSTSQIEGYIPAAYINYSVLSLYSNPVVNYSYSANGALVGYDTVSISYDDDSSNGKSELIYNCFSDNSNTYSALLMPGVPSSPVFLNGMLKKQIEYKKQGEIYIPVHYVENDYNLSEGSQFWCFKSEYHPPYSYGSISASSPTAPCLIYASGVFNPSQLLLYFYPIKIAKVNLIKKIEGLYDVDNIIINTTAYNYNKYQQLALVQSINSSGEIINEQTYYPSDYSALGDFTDGMRSKNMLDYPIETIKKVNGNTVSAIYNEYGFHDGLISLANIYTITPIAPLVNFSSSVPSNSRDIQYNVNPAISYKYDISGNVVEAQADGDSKKGYLWDYNYCYLIAEASNVANNDYAYTSFDSDGMGKWNLPSTIRDISQGYSGSKSYNLSNGAISKTGLNTSKSYIVSYWTKSSTSATVNNMQGTLLRNSNEWNYFEHTVPSGTSSIDVSGLIVIDDIRLIPSDAEMTTYNYKPLVGLTSRTDQKSLTSFYQYDSFNRLKQVRDQDGNIVKSFDYNYSKNWDGSNTKTFSNITLTKNFTKNNCASGAGIGTIVPYTIEAGTYTSIIHFGEANEQGFAEIEAKGQEYANTKGLCVTPECTKPVVQSVTNGPSLDITVSCYGASQYASSQILFISDPVTGEIYKNVTVPVNVNAISTTVPNKGRTYRFKLMTTGTYCNAISSDLKDIYIP